jgi:hypothetical protein
MMTENPTAFYFIPPAPPLFFSFVDFFATKNKSFNYFYL